MKIKECWGSYRERKIICQLGSIAVREEKMYLAESTILSFPQCPQSESTDVASPMITFRDRVILYGFRTDPTRSGIVVLWRSIRVLYHGVWFRHGWSGRGRCGRRVSSIRTFSKCGITVLRLPSTSPATSRASAPSTTASGWLGLCRSRSRSDNRSGHSARCEVEVEGERKWWTVALVQIYRRRDRAVPKLIKVIHW